MEKTKKCKYCKTEIPADAKVCPQCRKKLKGGKFKWILLTLIILCAIGAVTGGSNSNSSTKSTNSTSSKKKDIPKEYTSVSVNDMMADLVTMPWERLINTKINILKLLENLQTLTLLESILT